jgi:hypothetical protein
MAKHKNAILVTILAVINYALVIIFHLDCPWKKNFNIDCAGCGSTRMVLSLLKLDFYQAFRFNPFMFLTIVFLLLYLGYFLICKILKKNYIKLGTKTLVVFLVLLILFMVLRNINYFSFLKPTVAR